MKRLRYIVVAALATASIGFGAAPASACRPGACCEDGVPNVVWRKLTGNDLYYCPSA